MQAAVPILIQRVCDLHGWAANDEAVANLREATELNLVECPMPGKRPAVF